MNQQRWAARQSQDETAWGLCIEGDSRKPEWVIYPTKSLDSQDAAIIMASHNAQVDKLGTERSIQINSITNTRYEPIVEIILGTEVAQFHIREATQLAQQLDEVIEAAQADALLCRFMRDYVYHGNDNDQCKQAIGHMLVMFREFRKSFTDPVIETEGAADA